LLFLYVSFKIRLIILGYGNFDIFVWL